MIDEVEEDEVDDNGDGFSRLQVIKLAPLNSKSLEWEKVNLAESNRLIRLRKGEEGLRLILREAGGEEEDRSLSMASICRGARGEELKWGRESLG